MKYINPITAALLHVVGSLIVVFNSARLVRSGEELEPYTPLTVEVKPDTAAHVQDHKHEPVPALAKA